MGPQTGINNRRILNWVEAQMRGMHGFWHTIRDRPIAFRSPWQNAYVEGLIGSIRRSAWNHMNYIR
jgi:hypothetical protein